MSIDAVNTTISRAFVAVVTLGIRHRGAKRFLALFFVRLCPASS